ncbi:MAG: chemotaxis protein CheA [Deltaproteobacteria bacterium]|nr:chemotaxis protein CheA [Deltaproteobacteria bacterium]
MKKESDRERKREFLAEAEDILSTMGKGLLRLGKGVKAGIIDPAVLNSIFRSAHTLKASSSVFDFADMARLSHTLEDTLDMLRHGRITVSNECLSSIMTAHDLLVRIAASKGRKEFHEEVKKVEALLSAKSRPEKTAAEAQIDKGLLSTLTEYEAHRLGENIREGKNVFIIEAKFPVTSFDKIYISLIEALKPSSELIATLPSLKRVEPSQRNDHSLFFDIYIGTDRDKACVVNLVKEPFNAYTGTEYDKVTEPFSAGVRGLNEKTRDKTDAGGAFDDPFHISSPAPLAATDASLNANSLTSEWCGEGRVGDAETGNPQPESPAPPFDDTPQETLRKQTKSVRVNIKKLDGIMNLVSELGFLKSSLSELSSELKDGSTLPSYGIRLSRIEKLFEKKIAELRDSVLGARMIHIGQLFGRFDPFIDRVSRETQKEIRVVTYGDATEIDKLIIEELADPLMHIVRNVIDHAIEPPSEREAAHKPRSGTITLSAYQKGNHAVVEVRDDGRGIDEALLKKKAVEKGLLSFDAARGLSLHETLELIFLPGFSTCDAVSASSGRGVGMDVVKDNISRLSGMIDIETILGKGTRFILTIPVTLAVIDALIVEDGGIRYALPLNSITEVAAVTPLPADACPDACEAGGHVNINGRDMPSIRLGDILGRSACACGSLCSGIVTGGPGHRLCIIVERIIEELDVIVKPLPEMIKTPCIAGAADLGEKGAVLLLDIAAITDLAGKQRQKQCGHS